MAVIVSHGARHRGSNPALRALVLLAVVLTGCAGPSPTTSTPSPSPAAVEHFLVSAGVLGQPDSKHFADLRILRIGPDGTVPLTGSGCKDPDVNAQQDAIVYERYPGEIWVMGMHGQDQHRISPHGGGGWAEPKFLPDGHHLVASHDLGGGHQEIFVLDTRAPDVRQLTATGAAYPWKFRPDVDPTGRLLIVTYGQDSPRSTGPTSHIGVASITDDLIRDFTPLTAVDTRRPSYDAEFSLDGRSIVFDAGGMIWVANSDGTNEHAVASGRLARVDTRRPGWILYIHDEAARDLHTALWQCRMDGTDPGRAVDGNFTEGFAETTL